MNENSYSALKTDITAMIDFLQDRGIKVGEIRDYLSSHVKLPTQWDRIFSYIDSLEYSTVNKDIIRNMHRELSNKIKNLLLYSNKLIKVIKLTKEDFSILLKHYQSRINDKLNDYSIIDLISKDDSNEVEFQLDLSSDKIAFVTKKIVNDFVKVDIENRVDASLKEEFSNIVGFKEATLPALYAYIFDKTSHTIILSVDLAEIIKSRLVNMQMSNFSIDLKKAVPNLNFPASSKNLFHIIDKFYKNKEGFAKHLSLKTPDGVIYHAQANKQYPDARKSQYHVNGALSVNGKVSVYRIQKSFDTQRKTQYSIDLRSIAAMTTKPQPVLYEATLIAKNAEDFLEAIGKII